MKTIQNNVVGSTYLHRTELKNFQGEIKEDSPELNKKLQNRIKKGFDAPIYVRFENENYILDGHQRLIALNNLAEQGYMLENDKIPVVYIKAKTIEEAIEKVGEYNSNFANMNMGAMHDFFEGIDMANMNIPSFSFERTSDEGEEKQYKSNQEIDIDGLSDQGKKCTCPNCGHNFIVG